MISSRTVTTTYKPPGRSVVRPQVGVCLNFGEYAGIRLDLTLSHSISLSFTHTNTRTYEFVSFSRYTAATSVG